VAGGHEFKMGAEFRIYQLNNQQTGATLPTSLSPPTGRRANATAATRPPETPRQLSTRIHRIGHAVPGLTLQTKYTALFFQDNYKFTPHLTLNYGLRYEYETPRTDRYNELANFNYTPLLRSRLRGCPWPACWISSE